jgi:hypothetical protein
MAAHHVVELAIAKRHPLLGHQMVLPDCENLPPIGRKQKLNGRSFSPIMSGDPSQGSLPCRVSFMGNMRQTVLFPRIYLTVFFAMSIFEGHSHTHNSDPDPERSSSPCVLRPPSFGSYQHLMGSWSNNNISLGAKGRRWKVRGPLLLFNSPFLILIMSSYFLRLIFYPPKFSYLYLVFFAPFRLFRAL